MKGERQRDTATAYVYNSDGTVIESREMVVSDGWVRAMFPKDKRVEIIYSADRAEPVKPNRAERRKKKRGARK